MASTSSPSPITGLPFPAMCWCRTPCRLGLASFRQLPRWDRISGATLTWNIGTLNTNAGAQLAVTVQPASAGTFINYAIVSANTPDPNPADDFALPPSTPESSCRRSFREPPRCPVARSSSPSTAPRGRNISFRSSTNLINWVPVYTNPSPFVSPFTFTNSNTSSYPDLFYRVVTGP